MFSKNLFNYGIEKATWNYSEASHGKGAPDGIGEAVKRQADKLLYQKKDIPDALKLYALLHNK